MYFLLAIGGYLLGILWIILGLGDSEPLKLLVAAVWMAVGVKYTQKHRMEKYLKQLEEDNHGETHCSV